MSKEPRGQVIPIGEALREAFSDDVGPMASWTDEQWAKHDADVAARCAETERTWVQTGTKSAHQRLVDNGFPEMALEWAEKADETAPLIRKIADWDPKVSSVLVLSGTRGCGKTVAAAWWAKRQRVPPLFVRAPTFARSSRYEGDKRDELLRAPGLVLDDLGEEFMDVKGSFLVDLDELVDVYYGSRRPLIITTNCTKDVFVKRYGERIADRMRESAIWFSVSDASRRKRTT